MSDHGVGGPGPAHYHHGSGKLLNHFLARCIQIFTLNRFPISWTPFESFNESTWLAVEVGRLHNIHLNASSELVGMQLTVDQKCTSASVVQSVELQISSQQRRYSNKDSALDRQLPSDLVTARTHRDGRRDYEPCSCLVADRLLSECLRCAAIQGAEFDLDVWYHTPHRR